MKSIKQHEYKKVEDAIIHEIRKIAKEWNAGQPKKGSLLTESSRTWTSAFFKAIEKVRQQIDFGEYGSEVEGRSSHELHKDSEWLWDVTWRWYNKADKGHTILNGLYLACESELGTTKSAILSDFQKLLVADSKLKIFIFMRPRQSIEGEYIPILQDAVRGYWNGLGKSRLLVLAWDYNKDGQDFLFWRYNKSKEEFYQV
jgi:hypothetical protein